MFPLNLAFIGEHPVLFAQATEVAKTFLERLPEIIRAAATNPLGLVALIALAFCILVYFFFRGDSNPKIKLAALFGVFGSVILIALVAISKWHIPEPPNKTPQVCKVSGYVYNGDITPPSGMSNVKLAYVASRLTNAFPIQVATTGPAGHFSFDCSQIKSDDFPIHLRASYVLSGTSHAIESQDSLLFADNAEFNLFISPSDVSNHTRLSPELLRIPSTKLFRNNFSAYTGAVAPAHFTNKAIVTIPRNIHPSRETVNAIRSLQ